MSKGCETETNGMRVSLIMGLFGLVAVVLIWRVVDLQLFTSDFLQDHANARHMRVVEMPAYRGMIVDRNGEPLAVSTPVDSIWVEPALVLAVPEKIPALAAELGLDALQLEHYLAARSQRQFVYLRRHVDAQVATKVAALKIPGVAMQREFRRYYPTGEVAAQVVGFTDVDDRGQEGLELIFDDQLRGVSGKKLVIRDRLGRHIEDVERLQPVRPGRDLEVSIDRRIQYIAYRELKAATSRYKAHGGSIVVLDVKTGEIVAMVNQPSFNPNNRDSHSGEAVRNRAVTDVFEPGSTIKPFIVAGGLRYGNILRNTLIDTAPGFMKIGRHTVKDHKNNGKLRPAEILSHSSNVGASKIALRMEPADLWDTLASFGFGAKTLSRLPGESAGRLRDFNEWRDIDRATLAFGYGMSVTTLQLARAYMVLANNGVTRDVSITPITSTGDGGRQALPSRIAVLVRNMLTRVVSEGGTGTQAQVPGFSVAGKTGTVHKTVSGGYSHEDYVSLFAGMAPASDPRLVMVVMIDQPTQEDYFGGRVAAPVFSRVMAGALRVMNVVPDAARAKAGASVIAVSPRMHHGGTANDDG